MPELTVFTDDTKRKILFSTGSTLREILDASGLSTRSGCRGNGACGLCLVEIKPGDVNTPTENERLNLSPEQIEQNIRLACQLMPKNDLTVRIIKSASIAGRIEFAANQLCFSPSLFEAFIKLAQYIVRIKTQQDMWDHLGKFITTYFPAEWTAFVRRDPSNEISLYHSKSYMVTAERILTDDVRTTVAEVLDSGFLASQVIYTPAPSMTAFVPISEEYHSEMVLLIGHNSADTLSKELLNIYLAIAGLAGTTSERLKNERELNMHRSHLEELVKERTSELETANKELEAFCYSVSHDLRAPLRSIDGFSQELLNCYSDKLDDNGKDSLMRVRAASSRMARLIDDLLDLSRVSRTEMSRTVVELSAIAREVAEELMRTQPQRRVKFIIDDGLVDKGDERLLRIVFENLMGNAWKFTERHSQARIEVGVIHCEGRPAYFVRDDGAGFDMAYAKKLFEPFQRLHSANDFPGTGIGLATIQRIIQRHGGDVWAEGEVEKGATFYFTLR
jgi:signal transduction histidine kinase/ferredoxin